MEPLFENRLTVNEKVLREWHRKEFYKNNRLYVAVLRTGAVLFFALGAVWGLNTTLQNGGAFWWMVLLYFLGGAILLLLPEIRSRLSVWAMLRQDKDGEYPQDIATMFYNDAAVPRRLQGEDMASESGAEPVPEFWQQAEVLNIELDDVLHKAKKANPQSDEELKALGQQLEGLQKQVETLAQKGRNLRRIARYPYGNITDYLQTKNLYILYYGDVAVLAQKGGFVKGNEEQFGVFLRRKLQQAADDAQDARVRRSLQKALRGKWGRQERAAEEAV